MLSKIKRTELDALRAFTRASCRSIRSYFTSKLIEHNKNKYKNQDILPQKLRLDIYYVFASLSILFIQSHVVCLIFEVLFTTILVLFSTSEVHVPAS